MQPLVFLFVYHGDASEKKSENPRGLGHMRRCTLLQKKLLQQDVFARQNQKKSPKISVEIIPFSTAKYLLDAAQKISPDVVLLDARESVDKTTIVALQDLGIFTVILDSDDVEALNVADYHVRSLPWSPSLLRWKKKSEPEIFWAKQNGDAYQQKDIFPQDFPQKSQKYSLPWANLYGWEYLCAKHWEKVSAELQNNHTNTRKVVFYLGDFFDDDALMRRYLCQWKKVISRDFWDEPLAQKSKKEVDFSLECVLIIHSSQEKNQDKIRDFFWQSVQNDDQNDRFLPLSVCRCQNILPAEKMSALLGDCHLFLTHCGVSFLQALQAGIPVALLLPTKYHQSISRFYFSTMVLEQIDFYGELLQNIQKCDLRKNIGASQDTLALALLQMATFWAQKKSSRRSKRNVCYYCESRGVRILHRFPTFSWQYCEDCGAAIQQRYGLEEIFSENFPDYNSDYFEKEYQESYGLTYGEDEKKIKAMARLRLQHIQSFFPKNAAKNPAKKRWVLDIGAAYGFFLDVMQEQGSFATAGVEISSHAFSFARKRHRLFQGDVQKLDFNDILRDCGAKHFDVVSMWYVIEHFPCLHPLLQKISDCQQKGGVLAFSTPNFLGLTAIQAKKKFIESSPLDHFHLLTSRGLAKLLRRYGYELSQVVSTGIHRDRYQRFFPRLSRWMPFAVYRFLAQKKNWGDTMELYFRKV